MSWAAPAPAQHSSSTPALSINTLFLSSANHFAIDFQVIKPSFQDIIISQFQESMGLDAKSEIVLALAAPIHIRQTPPRRTLAVAAFKFESRSHDVVAEELIIRLKLSGCAVISEGVLVVEGETSAINRFFKFVRQIVHKKPDFGVKVIWRGKVCKSSFGKFSILRHCSSDSHVRKFFADHGASHYWDLVNSFMG